ncbi:hypothetical protein GEV43_32825 [Actinomadura sp. J1-007]|nr:hypothetical protein [Actinomadura sp. J1-007]
MDTITRRLPAVLTAVALAVLLAWPSITGFYSYNDGYYNGIVASACISAVLTISLNLAMGYGGMLSMMHTGLQLLGGYGAGHLVVKAGAPWYAGIAAGVALGAVLSAAVLLISLRATYLYFGMITLAANLIVVEGGKEWEDLTGGLNGIVGIAPGGLSKTAFYYVVLAFLVLTYIVQRNLVRSGVGRAAMAVRESPDAAAAMGIRPATTKALVFSIAGGLAGLAGALYALQLGFINPDVGLLDNGLVFFVGLFVGGIGTLAGPILGVALIALLVELIKDHARYTTLILGVALLAAMMVIPRGVVGTWGASRFGRRPDREDTDPAGGLPDSVLPPPPPGDVRPSKGAVWSSTSAASRPWTASTSASAPEPSTASSARTARGSPPPSPASPGSIRWTTGRCWSSARRPPATLGRSRRRASSASSRSRTCSNSSRSWTTC